MESRSKIYFVSDVHLGLPVGDPEEREARFVKFLKALPEDTKALYLMGDIWDFWYEYRDVVPKLGFRVVAELVQLMDRGVEVYFTDGNHDMWTFSFFESLGMKKFHQPYVFTEGSHTLCIGHGDGLGGAKWSYRLMLGVFHNRVAQALFSLLHPWIAYRFGLGWSNSNRRKHTPYHFRGSDEPLWKFASGFAVRNPQVDCFIFGHFHDSVDLSLDGGRRLIVVKDWISGGTPFVLLDGDVITIH